MTPKLGNLSDIDWGEEHPLFKPKAVPTTDDRVRELIEWADQQPMACAGAYPEKFED